MAADDPVNGPASSIRLKSDYIFLDGLTQIADGLITAAKITDGTIVTAKIADAAIGSAKIASVLQSDNFAPGYTGSGWRITRDGSIEANDITIRRNLALAQGSFTIPDSLASGASLELPFVNTGIRIGNNDVWTVSGVTLLATVKIVPSSATNAADNSIWRARADVYNPFKWLSSQVWDDANAFEFPWTKDPATLVTPPWASGTGQRVLMDIDIRTTAIVMNGPMVVYWKVYQVT